MNTFPLQITIHHTSGSFQGHDLGDPLYNRDYPRYSGSTPTVDWIDPKTQIITFNDAEQLWMFLDYSLKFTLNLLISSSGDDSIFEDYYFTIIPKYLGQFREFLIQVKSLLPSLKPSMETDPDEIEDNTKVYVAANIAIDFFNNLVNNHQNSHWDEGVYNNCDYYFAGSIEPIYL